MDKRTLLALGLSFALIGLYPVVIEKFYPGTYSRQPKKEAAAPIADPANAALSADKSVSAAPVSIGNAASDGRTYVPSGDLILDDGRVRLVFGSLDASLREVSFSDYKDPDTRVPLELFSFNEAGGGPFRVDVAGAPAQGSFTGQTQGNSAVFTGKLSTLELVKEIRLDPRTNSGKLKLTFRNPGAAPAVASYTLCGGTTFPDRSSIDKQYAEANFYYQKEGKPHLKHIQEKRQGKSVSSEAPLEWLAVKDRQFSVILKPEAGKPFVGRVEGLGHDKLRAYLVSGTFTLDPGASRSDEFLFYIGPNEIGRLQPVGLDAIVNFGKFDLIAKLLVGGLGMLEKIFRNYGLAIIALTLLINLVLFPLTRQSYMSMKRMQLIQPQMNKLREQHKSSPDKLHREMMALYKKHKVNPFGGCLPMLLQMPVFIALYVSLAKTSELMNSRFLWIRDLSSPDKVPMPFSLPLVGHELHVLPLLVAALMALQQKFATTKIEGQDPAMEAQQRMMAVIMPIMFGFFLYGLPSGLVLYWFTHTLVTALYQLRIKNLKLAS